MFKISTARLLALCAAGLLASGCVTTQDNGYYDSAPIYPAGGVYGPGGYPQPYPQAFPQPYPYAAPVYQSYPAPVYVQPAPRYVAPVGVNLSIGGRIGRHGGVGMGFGF